MYQEERLFRIMSYLETHETMSVGDICTLFGVSRDTARRDIVKLTSSGAVTRTHGGIGLTKFEQKIQGYISRTGQEPEEKKRIARYAAQLIQQNETVFLDVSTTVRAMIEVLPKLSLSVVTHSIDNAWALLEAEQVETHLLGGMIARESRHMYGYGTLEKIKDYRFSRAFFGAAGFMPDGIYYCCEDDGYFKRAVAERSDYVVVVADHSKMGKATPYRGLDFEGVDLLITCGKIPTEMEKVLREKKVDFLTV